jgi:lipoprotein-releasing system permease protein
MIPLYALLAWRYLWSPHRDRAIVNMVRICFFSIFLGTVALTLTLGIMHGFEQATTKKLQSICPHIMMRPAQSDIDVTAVQNTLAREYKTVEASAPNMQQFVMVQDPHAKTLSTIATFKAIDPEREAQVTALASMIIKPCQPTPSLATLVYDNRVLIGNKLAQQLERSCGQPITLWYAPEHDDATLLQKTTVIINGIFATGIEEYDLNLIIGHLDFAHELYPNQPIDEIGIKLAPGAHVPTVVHQLAHQFDTLEILSWHDLYPALVAALKLEKYAMFFVILLITLVACMNMMALIFMQITQKQRDIAILKAYGFSDKQTCQTFFYMGMTLACISCMSGLLTAWLIGIVLQKFPFITLPDVYYTTQLPITLQPWIFASVGASVLTLAFIAVIVPLKNISRMVIATILRFEG